MTYFPPPTDINYNPNGLYRLLIQILFGAIDTITGTLYHGDDVQDGTKTYLGIGRYLLMDYLTTLQLLNQTERLVL